MGAQHLVVDGSNIATEGRSMPSLQQLLDAVDAVTKEFDHDNVTVIVDATFGHRIESSERAAYDEATSKGEIITPPAGVIGRGDAFILEVADRADAVVLSNDSFQEFHGKYDWLFEEGRLLGGKHVPGVGWIFLARSPVRGPTSRRAVSDAKRKRRGSKKAETSRPKKTAKAKAKTSSRSSSSAAKSTERKAGGQAQRKSGGKEPEPYNEPLPFIEFVGAHPVGSIVEGEVEQFSSHGAYILVDGTRCYVPLKAMAQPAPRSARDVLELGETREFVVVAIDTPRRGIDLSVPGVEASDDDGDDVDDVEPTPEPETKTSSRRPRGRSRSRAASDATSDDVAPQTEAEPAPSRNPADATPAGDDQKLSVSQRRKLRAQQAAAEQATSEPSETVRETMATKKKAPAKKAAAKKKSAAKKAPAKRKTAAKKAPAKRKTTAKKAPAKRKSAAKKAPAKRKAAAKKAPAKKKAATKKRAAAKKTTRKRA
jgi:hypothetical protein